MNSLIFSVQNVSSTITSFTTYLESALVTQSDACLTGDQEVADSILARYSKILLWRLIMKYFLGSFSPFC